MKKLLFLLLVLLFQGNTPQNCPAIEEKRLALVIGNAQYEHIGTLKNPVNDAIDIAQTLKGFGFETFLHTDLTLKGMKTNVEAFVKKIQDHKSKGHHVTALVYYAGHGIQHREANYLLPVEVNIQECDQLEYDAYLLKRLMVQVQSADVRIFMIDACRTPPKGNSCLRDLPTAGLKPISTSALTTNTDINLPQGTLISYSADADKPAEDGKGRNSPYAESFLKILRETPDKEANSLFDELVNEVWLKTNKVQSPWKNGSLRGGKFYFKKPTEKKEEAKKEVVENKPTPTLPTENKDLPKDYTITIKGVTFKMVYVQGGTFQMGSNDGDENEKPVHPVTLTDYYIAETEVTQELWEAVMGTNPSNFKGKQRPIEMVSWEDAQAFIGKLNEIAPPKGGGKWHLPTEAQWEYAAKGGKQSKDYVFAGSNNILYELAWYSDNSNAQTHIVGEKKPNELGLKDMIGNVREWCEDDYASDAYTKAQTANIINPILVDKNIIYDVDTSKNIRNRTSSRILRGGSYNSAYNSCPVFRRGGLTPTFINSTIGFRVVCL